MGLRQSVRLELAKTSHRVVHHPSIDTMSAPASQSRPTAAAMVEAAPLATSVVIAVVASSFLLTGLSGANNFGITCLMPKLALWSPLSSYYRVWTSWMRWYPIAYSLQGVKA